MSDRAWASRIFRLRPGFDWSRVRWSGPLAPVDETCSYCGAAIPEEDVPLRMWTPAGDAAVFCYACMRTWWGIESFNVDGFVF